MKIRSSLVLGPARLLFLSILSLPLLLSVVSPAARAQSALDGFDPNANGAVRAVVVQPDGKILLGGDFTALSPNGGAAVTRNRIARLNPDGTLDAAFNPNASDTVYAIAVQADGKILVGGDFNGASSIGGQTRNRIARLEMRPLGGAGTRRLILLTNASAREENPRILSPTPDPAER